jgi:hypothetical protein
MKRTAALIAISALSFGMPAWTPPALAQSGATSAADPYFSVDFAGGTVTQYVEALRKTGKPVNVVVSERAGRQRIGAISLSRVTPGVAVHAINAAAASTLGDWRIDQIGPEASRAAGKGMPEVEAYWVDFMPKGVHSQDVMVEAYSLARVFKPDGKAEGLDPKAVLTAIETGLRLQNQEPDQAPDLKFHPDSGLLFVRGTMAELRLVGSIVGRMMDDARAKSQSQQRREREAAMRGIAMKDAQLEVQIREVELRVAEESLEQVRKLAETGAAHPSEVQGAQLQLGRARVNLERARLGLERAQIAPLAGADGEGPGEAQPSPLPPAAAEGAAPVPSQRGPSTKRPAVK